MAGRRRWPPGQARPMVVQARPFSPRCSCLVSWQPTEMESPEACSSEEVSPESPAAEARPSEDERSAGPCLPTGHRGGVSGAGCVLHKNTAFVLCMTTVENEGKLQFSKIPQAIKANFKDKFHEVKKNWGGGVMGSKSQVKTKGREKLLAKEAAQRMTYDTPC